MQQSLDRKETAPAAAPSEPAAPPPPPAKVRVEIATRYKKPRTGEVCQLICADRSSDRIVQTIRHRLMTLYLSRPAVVLIASRFYGLALHCLNVVPSGSADLPKRRGGFARHRQLFRREFVRQVALHWQSHEKEVRVGEDRKLLRRQVREMAVRLRGLRAIARLVMPMTGGCRWIVAIARRTWTSISIRITKPDGSCLLYLA
jgi:hypothetical protein